MTNKYSKEEFAKLNKEKEDKIVKSIVLLEDNILFLDSKTEDVCIARKGSPVLVESIDENDDFCVVDSVNNHFVVPEFVMQGAHTVTKTRVFFSDLEKITYYAVLISLAVLLICTLVPMCFDNIPLHVFKSGMITAITAMWANIIAMLLDVIAGGISKTSRRAFYKHRIIYGKELKMLFNKQKSIKTTTKENN